MSNGVFRRRYFLPPRTPVDSQLALLSKVGQTDYVIGDPNGLNGGTWGDIDIGTTSLGTAIDGLPQPIIIPSSGQDYGRRYTSITTSGMWVDTQTRYFKIEFNFGISGLLYFVIYDGVGETIFTWNGTSIPYQLNDAGTVSNVTQYTVAGHKELYFQIVPIRSNGSIEMGVGPNSLTFGQTITLFDMHMSDTAWAQPSAGAPLFMLMGQNGTYTSRIM